MKTFRRVALSCGHSCLLLPAALLTDRARCAAWQAQLLPPCNSALTRYIPVQPDALQAAEGLLLCCLLPSPNRALLAA